MGGHRVVAVSAPAAATLALSGTTAAAQEEPPAPEISPGTVTQMNGVLITGPDSCNGTTGAGSGIEASISYDGETVTSWIGSTDRNGRWVISWNLPHDAEPGTYTVEVTCDRHDGSGPQPYGPATFTATELPGGFIATAQPLVATPGAPIEIRSDDPCPRDGTRIVLRAAISTTSAPTAQRRHDPAGRSRATAHSTNRGRQR
jgi:hypothetical protein